MASRWRHSLAVAPIEAPSPEGRQLRLSNVRPFAAEPQARAPADQAARTISPFSERLTIDTRLDPAVLVSPEDLPVWLGGLGHLGFPLLRRAPHSIFRRLKLPPRIEAPEPYVGVDAPEDGVIDVQVNGWYLIAAAIGLLILLAAALRLYYLSSYARSVDP